MYARKSELPKNQLKIIIITITIIKTIIIVKIMTIINFQLTLQVHTISSVYITMYGTY